MTSSVSLRFWHLMNCVPDFLGYRSVLYIGGNKSRLQLVPELVWAGAVIDIVEIWEPYIRELSELNKTKHYFRRIMQGDVKELTSIVTSQYDLSVWWHGPEHTTREDLPLALRQLQQATRQLAVVGCPHGHCAQGVTKDGNIYQCHRAHWLPEDFVGLGWTAAVLKEQPGMDSHLIAWWRRETEQVATKLDTR